MPEGHDCPIDGCHKTVPSTMLMCGGHWRKVSRATQREVYSAYDHGRGQGSEAHVAAVNKAIHEVEA